MKNILNLGFVLILGFGSLAKADYSAEIFEQNSNKAKKLFTFEYKTIPAEGFDMQTITYKDLQGEVVFQEKMQLKGIQISKVEISQNQTKQSAVVEVKDGKIFFSKTVEGKTKTSEEKLDSTFVMSGSFQRYVKENWKTLSVGKSLEFRYGVWDRQETVGFSLIKVSEEQVQGEQAVVLKMKPSSFLIAALVKPVFFKFKSDGSRLLEMNGRVAPKKKSGDSWKDLDAEVVYHEAKTN